MSKSSRLRAVDFRAVRRLADECRDLGDDSPSWRAHFAQRRAGLAGCGLGITAEMGSCLFGPRKDLGTVVWGWQNGFDPEGWLRMLSGFHRNPAYNPLMNAYIRRLADEDGVCLARSDVIEDRDWYPSAYYRQAHLVLAADATLCCFRRVPGAADEFSEVFLARLTGERDFSAREKALAHEAMAAVGPLVGSPLARFADPSPAALSGRRREVLRCLLEGDSDKQIAARLRISPLTVNVHVKAVYRHFGVGGRGELLARWIRRGWRAGPWDEP